MLDERAEDVYHKLQRTIKRRVSPDGKAGAEERMEKGVGAFEVEDDRLEGMSGRRDGNRRSNEFLKGDRR